MNPFEPPVTGEVSPNKPGKRLFPVKRLFVVLIILIVALILLGVVAISFWRTSNVKKIIESQRQQQQLKQNQETDEK